MKTQAKENCGLLIPHISRLLSELKPEEYVALPATGWTSSRQALHGFACHTSTLDNIKNYTQLFYCEGNRELEQLFTSKQYLHVLPVVESLSVSFKPLWHL